ncbi:MAG TPA: helix-turn-helix domain-containing protein [Tepidisphaeraceae bacterium]|nr:helix-turn-helix domain-containing protein [Tepidisphaeraceae bacterium]
MTKNRQSTALAVVKRKNTSVGGSTRLTAGGSTSLTAGKAKRLAAKAKVAELLMGGESVADAARQTGVTRKTIYDWLSHDLMFRKAFNEWQNAVQKEARREIMALVPKAIASLSGGLDELNPKLAMELLTKLKMFESAPPQKATDRQGLEEEAAMEEMTPRTLREIAQLKLMTERAIAVFSCKEWSRPVGENATVSREVTPEGVRILGQPPEDGEGRIQNDEG